LYRAFLLDEEGDEDQLMMSDREAFVKMKETFLPHCCLLDNDNETFELAQYTAATLPNLCPLRLEHEVIGQNEKETIPRDM
jgi:hypothetical protein